MNLRPDRAGIRFTNRTTRGGLPPLAIHHSPSGAKTESDPWRIREVIPGLFLSAGNRHRYLVIDVGEFSVSELSAYLADRLGEDWPDIPLELRGTLRRPLLARIYSDVAPRGRWRPTNEFALLDRYWARLREDEQADHPSDIVGLRRLALSLLSGKPYPWTEEQVHAQLADDSVSRLIRIGILRRSPDGRYVVWHDRLLNWAVAESLVSSVRAGESSVSDLCSRVLSISASPIGNGTSVAQVATDVLWLLSEDERDKDEIVTQMMKELEGLPWGPRDELLSSSVAKVGPRLVPALGRRLEAVTDCGDSDLPHQYLRGMTAIDAEETPREAIRLLNSKSALVQRMGARLLVKRPSIAALDRLWQLRCFAHSEPSRFLWQHDQSDDSAYVHEDFLNALRSCIRVSLKGKGWLERAIQVANPDSDPVFDLAYLLANLDDEGDLWKRCKATLFLKIQPTGKVRSLAVNILRYRDADEVDWLLEQVPQEQDLVGPVALRALNRIRPDLATEHLQRLPAPSLYVTRHWCFAALLAIRPAEARAGLLKRLQEDFSWQLVAVYQGDSDDLDIPTLEFLLDATERELRLPLGHATSHEPRHLYTLFSILGGVRRLDLLECLGRWGGTPLEERLTEWLISESSSAFYY